MLKEVQKGLMGRTKGLKDIVFCFIYCENSQPYLNYDFLINHPDIYKQNQINSHCPLVLAQMRWDGTIGIPGGNVEKQHITLEEAIKDELREEINLTNIDDTKLEILATYEYNNCHCTTFSYPVSYEELLTIFKDTPNAKHFHAENSGNFFLQVSHYSLDNLLSQNYSGDGKNQFKDFLLKKNLIVNKQMLDKALLLSKKAFHGVKRKNGKDYYEEHILGTVELVKNYPLEYQIVIALHDLIEDTSMTFEDLEKDFPKFIVQSVKDLTLDKNNDLKKEINKCLNSPLSIYCRFIDRLNNLQSTSYETMDEYLVNKIIFRTINYYMPCFSQSQNDILYKEIDRILKYNSMDLNDVLNNFK